MAQGVCKLLWLQRLLEELKLFEKNKIILYGDNKVAISIAQNPISHDQSKHIEFGKHFIKEKLTDGVLSLDF